MKKIAVNTVKAFLKEHKSDEYTTATFTVGEGGEFEAYVKTKLSVIERSAFINRVLSGCFDAAGNYRPEYVEPMIRATVLQICTNIPPITLKGEQDANGAQVLDLDAMSDLYAAMGLDNLDNPDYQDMMDEITAMCWQAVEWKKARSISDAGVDSALRRLLDAVTEKVEETDMDSLMQYTEQLSKTAKGLDEDRLLKGIVEYGQKEARSRVIDITEVTGK